MAKGGQGPASPAGGPSLGQEIVGLKKTIDEKQKVIAEQKSKLEEFSSRMEEMEKEKVKLQEAVSLSEYIWIGLAYLIYYAWHNNVLYSKLPRSGSCTIKDASLIVRDPLQGIQGQFSEVTDVTELNIK